MRTIFRKIGARAEGHRVIEQNHVPGGSCKTVFRFRSLLPMRVSNIIIFVTCAFQRFSEALRGLSRLSGRMFSTHWVATP